MGIKGLSGLIGGAALALLAAVYLATPGRDHDRATSPALHETLSFPKGFLWGAAIAGQQAESQQPSDWTAFEEEVAKSGRFEAGKGYGTTKPGHVRDLGQWPDEVRHRKSAFDSFYADDIAAAAGMGMNSLRVSIEWARLFPKPGMTAPDPAGIAHYRAVFAEMRTHRIRPIVTLFHYASPAWFWTPDAKGRKGWERADALGQWRRYAKAVADAFVPEVEIWCTLNEPMVYLQSGYIEGAYPPLERRPDFAAAQDVYVALLRAHAIAYDELHRAAAAKGTEVRVGITQNVVAFEPLRPLDPLDRVVALLAGQAWNRDFLDAIAGGKLTIAASNVEREIPDLKGKQDYVGLNYYSRIYVSAPLADPTAPEVTYDDPAQPDEPKTDMGWPVYPKGLHDLLLAASKRYGKPIYILENGAADHRADDRIRQAYLKAHLREVSLAIRDGADVKGYMAWSLLDNFEWAEGFGPRFGMIAVDYANGFKRTPRPSTRLYRDIATANALPTEE